MNPVPNEIPSTYLTTWRYLPPPAVNIPTISAEPTFSKQAKRSVPPECTESASKRMSKSQIASVQKTEAVKRLHPWLASDIDTLVKGMTSNPPKDIKEIAAELGRTPQACYMKYRYFSHNQRLRPLVDPESRLNDRQFLLKITRPFDQGEQDEFIRLYKEGYKIPNLSFIFMRSLGLCTKLAANLNLNQVERKKLTVWDYKILWFNTFVDPSVVPSPIKGDPWNNYSDPSNNYFDADKLYEKQ